MSGERTAEWLVEQIEAHAPERTEDGDAALRLAEACAALDGASAQAFGLALPEDLPGRDELGSARSRCSSGGSRASIRIAWRGSRR